MATVEIFGNVRPVPTDNLPLDPGSDISVEGSVIGQIAGVNPAAIDLALRQGKSNNFSGMYSASNIEKATKGAFKITELVDPEEAYDAGLEANSSETLDLILETLGDERNRGVALFAPIESNHQTKLGGFAVMGYSIDHESDDDLLIAVVDVQKPRKNAVLQLNRKEAEKLVTPHIDTSDETIVGVHFFALRDTSSLHIR